MNLSFAKKIDESAQAYAAGVTAARLKFPSPSGMRLQAIMQPAVESARVRINSWVQIVRDACKEANRPVDNEVRAYIRAEVHNQCEGARKQTAHNLAMTLQRESMQHVSGVRESLSTQLNQQISQIETEIGRDLKIEELKENVQSTEAKTPTAPRGVALPDRPAHMSSRDATERRRSSRLMLAIPIKVSSIDLLGQPFKELTTTITVNRHGCTYKSKHHLPKGSIVTLENEQSDSASPARLVTGRVAWMQRPHSVRDFYQIGLEFEKPDNVWGIKFPPEARSAPSSDKKKRLTFHDPIKFDDHSELVEEVEEIIVEESAEDRIKDYVVASSHPRKTEATVKTRKKKRKKKKKTYDVFICHASEDKTGFVRPLAEALRAQGLRVWYDEFTLRVGDGLRRSIDKGLAASKFGAVVVSPSFFKKQWPQRELDGLVAKEIDDRRVILPVWHNVSLDEVREHSITLADRIAANSSEGIQKVVEKLLLAIRGNG